MKCLYCIDDATTTDTDGNPACLPCRQVIAPQIGDAIRTDLVRGRVLSSDWHTPMRPEQAEQVRRSFDGLAGWPLEGLERLLKDVRGES